MNVSFKDIITDPIHFIAFGFGAGLSPYAPGTFGTLVALPMAYFMHNLPLLVYVGITTLITLIGVYVADRSSARLGVHDFGGIVIDEIAGMLWVMACFPITLLNLCIGFVLFRLFDIWKPWPIRVIDEKVKGGLGIMLDDLLAAAYSIIVMGLILRFI